MILHLKANISGSWLPETHGDPYLRQVLLPRVPNFRDLAPESTQPFLAARLAQQAKHLPKSFPPSDTAATRLNTATTQLMQPTHLTNSYTCLTA